MATTLTKRKPRAGWGGSAEGEMISPLARLRDEMDRLFERATPSWLGGHEGGGLLEWSPEAELSETDEEFIVRFEVPGIEPKDVSVSVSGNRLTVEGEKREESEHRDKTRWMTELRYGAFRRMVELPSTVDVEKVAAEQTNGVLTIRLPKTEQESRRKIPVKAPGAGR